MLGAIWGVGGFMLLLGFAALRLIMPAREAFSYSFTWYHWASLSAIVLLLLYVKGYRAFQKGLSRRVVMRARQIKADPGTVRVLLAPLYCMGFFGAGLRRGLMMAGITAAMVGFIFLVRLLPQPWRGIVDVGLVGAFSWGFVATVLHVAARTDGRKQS
jgi:hypothetical protein